MKWGMIGFGFVAIAAVGVMDYQQKSRSAGVEFGALSFQDYTGTLQAQFDDMKAAQARKKELKALAAHQKQGAKRYLPEEGNGWRRRAFNAGDNSAISSVSREAADYQAQYIGEKQGSAIGNMFGTSETEYLKHQNADSWVYAKGNAEIYVRAKFVQPRRKDTMSGMAATMISNNMNAMASRSGFAVIQGVAYTQVRSYDDFTPGKSDKSREFRSFEAFLGVGQEVRITARASRDTSDAQLFELLEAIDYVGMNSLLAHPVKGIGPDAPDFTREAQVAMAEVAMNTRRRILQMDTKAAREAMQNLDPLTMTFKEIQTRGATTQTVDTVNDDRLRKDPADANKSAASKQEAMELVTAPSDDVNSMGWAEKLGALAAIAGFGKSLEAQEPTETVSANTRSECSMVGTRKHCRIVSE